MTYDELVELYKSTCGKPTTETGDVEHAASANDRVGAMFAEHPRAFMELACSIIINTTQWTGVVATLAARLQHESEDKAQKDLGQATHHGLVLMLARGYSINVQKAPDWLLELMHTLATRVNQEGEVKQ
jgi:hypothetical protein